MNAYIRDFDPVTVETKIAKNAQEAKNILRDNDSKNNFSVFHNNIRSITKNNDEFQITLSEFGHMFDCIVLSETFRVDNVDIFNIPGYNIIYNEGEINKNDGVIIYIKTNINYNYEIVYIDQIKAINLTIQYEQQ